MQAAAEAARRLEPLLHAQAKALREGRADDLKALNPRIQHALGVLSALAQGPLSPAVAAELMRLKALVNESQAWIARRNAGVEQVLEALAAGSGGLQQRQQMQTYGARGAYAASGLRGTGFGRA